MMIASWMNDSVSSQVVITRLSPITPVNQFAGRIPACDAKKRDREVPYGMKGGEH